MYLTILAAIPTCLCVLGNIYNKFREWRESISNSNEPIPLDSISANVQKQQDQAIPKWIPINNVALNPKIISTIGLNLFFWLGTALFLVLLFNTPYLDFHAIRLIISVAPFLYVYTTNSALKKFIAEEWFK